MRIYREVQSLLQRPHAQWLIAPGMLLALIDRDDAAWLALLALVILFVMGLLELDIKPDSPWLKWIDGLAVLAFSCLAMLLARMVTEIVLNAMRVPRTPGSALWLAAVVLTGGWVVWTIKRLWLFAFGVTQIAWGIVVGLNSQSLLKDPAGSLQLVSIVTGVFLVTRGLSDCADANLAFAGRQTKLGGRPLAFNSKLAPSPSQAPAARPWRKS